jgi:hypothetical protein
VFLARLFILPLWSISTSGITAYLTTGHSASLDFQFRSSGSSFNPAAGRSYSLICFAT